MSDRKPIGNQIPTITPLAPQQQESFDLNRLDVFVTSLGIDFVHYKATPSPIGKSDRGDLRRNDGVDTITSNGMIYRCAGKFTATITDSSRQQHLGQSGLVDPAEARLVLPRFYNKNAVADGDRIYLAPGDRLYIGDPNADVKVANYQLMDYQPNIDNEPMFPIVKLEDKIVDSTNTEYKENIDFVITNCGNIRWLPEGKNPGIDPNTGKGRVYSIRYLYNAYYYVVSLHKEVRITNVTQNNVRKPERMPMYAMIVREYMFHNTNRSQEINQSENKAPQRAIQAPIEPINPNSQAVPVNMSDFTEDDSYDGGDDSNE